MSNMLEHAESGIPFYDGKDVLSALAKAGCDLSTGALAKAGCDLSSCLRDSSATASASASTSTATATAGAAKPKPKSKTRNKATGL